MPDESSLPVPVTGELVTRKGSTGMAVDNQQITVHFVHPTDSTNVLTATVGSASTPNYLINQLVRNDFMAKAGPNAEYKLVDTSTMKELADHVTLAAAGVAPNATLSILHNVTGAEPGACVR
jgi:hypothetical protein